MPPRRTNTSPSSTKTPDTAFGRAHPSLQRALILSCEASPFLLIATIASGTGIWKRPNWQRALLWRAAMWSFFSRWVLVGCAITWSWNDWGRVEQEQPPPPPPSDGGGAEQAHDREGEVADDGGDRRAIPGRRRRRESLESVIHDRAEQRRLNLEEEQRRIRDQEPEHPILQGD